MVIAFVSHSNTRTSDVRLTMNVISSLVALFISASADSCTDE